jgi:hypothetical protein
MQHDILPYFLWCFGVQDPDSIHISYKFYVLNLREKFSEQAPSKRPISWENPVS